MEILNRYHWTIAFNWTLNYQFCAFTWKYTKWKSRVIYIMMNRGPFPNDFTTIQTTFLFTVRSIICSPKNTQTIFGIVPIMIQLGWFIRPSSPAAAAVAHLTMNAIVNSTSFNWFNNIVWPMFMFVRTCEYPHNACSTNEILWESQFVFGPKAILCLFAAMKWNS